MNTKDWLLGFAKDVELQLHDSPDIPEGRKTVVISETLLRQLIDNIRALEVYRNCSECDAGGYFSGR